ncbi:MAG: EFR1 family ferrodoxin [Candidatus Coproplasma sp.]
MKIGIFYFSGTGNTAKIADLYRQIFENEGHSCELFTLPLKEEADFSSFDMLGIGYPIHGFNAPKLVLDFAKKLPKRKDGFKTFIFKSSGEPVKMSRVSSLKLIQILKRRGYKVTNEYQYVMPYNMIFRHTDHMAFKFWQTAQSLAPIDCKDIINGVERHEKKFFMGHFFAFVMRIEYWGFHFNGLFYKARKGCIGCGKCARECPVGNIEMKDGKPDFKSHCIMCARCSFNCPVNCIRIGLFDSWRVNGAYSFKDGDPNEKNGHENYCKKAYDRYFKEAQERISSAESVGAQSYEN